MVVSAGLEKFFQEIGTPVAAGTFLPPPTMDEAAQQWMQEIARKYGQVSVPAGLSCLANRADPPRLQFTEF